MSYWDYWDEVDAKRQAQRDFERRHRPEYGMYDRCGNNSQRAYADEFDRCRREEERRQEERREEERKEKRREEEREEERREQQRQYEEDYYARQEVETPEPECPDEEEG